MTDHQLQTGGGRMLLSAVWRIYEESQVLLKGVQQGFNKWIVGLVREVHEVLICAQKQKALSHRHYVNVI